MSVEDRRETVAFYEAKLAAAQKQRDTILLDKRAAEARVDAGDRPARFEVATLGNRIWGLAGLFCRSRSSPKRPGSG
jgi:hypothetical protein